MAILKCCPHLSMTDSGRAWPKVFPHVFPFTASAADTHGFLSCCGGGVCVQLTAVSPRRTTEDLITPASLHVISFLQLACKHASANYCLHVACVCHPECVWEKEKDWAMSKIHCLKHTAGQVMFQTLIVRFSLWLPDASKLLPMCPHKFTCWTVATHFFFFNTPPCAKFSFAMNRTRGEITQSREWCHTSICACVVV